MLVNSGRSFFPLEDFVLLKTSIDLLLSCVPAYFILSLVNTMFLVSIYKHSSLKVFFRLHQFYRHIDS